MDIRPRPFPDLLQSLHDKFGVNLGLAKSRAEIAGKCELTSRIIQHIGVLLGKNAAVLEHQKLIAKSFDELFGDLTCAIYFAFCALDNPSRMILRRALELGLVCLAYWDDPRLFWQWKAHDGEVRFSDLFATVSNKGYMQFLSEEGWCTEGDVQLPLNVLKNEYSKLSNVVHPKLYNFETDLPHRFQFSESDLLTSIQAISMVEKSLLQLFLCRFRTIKVELEAAFPMLDELM